MPAPTLHTPRLTLRHHVLSDMEPFWEFYQSDRAAYVDPPKDRTPMWYGFASDVGSWDLMGFGAWAVEVNGQLAGQISIMHPPHFPEREIGWIFLDGFEGKGYALEAASAALQWAWEQGMPTLVSYIDHRNARSIALAQRLGAERDPQAATYDDVDVVYRHHPDADGSPEANA